MATRRNGGDSLTTIYRSAIGGLLAVLIGLVTWFGDGLFKGQSELKDTVSNLANQLQQEIGNRSTELATIRGDVGRNTGNLDALSQRVNAQGSNMTTQRDGLIQLRTQFDDYVRAHP